uniref:Ig-like domain-containing protein n=1 Tax=Periophthalmus magnuspinnatus TaxID=409849 RepID=A0A3B4ACT7_9GOBI
TACPLRPTARLRRVNPGLVLVQSWFSPNAPWCHSEPPEFLRPLQSVEAVRGAVAQLECAVSGSAPFEVSWRRNKKRLASGPKFQMVSLGPHASLEIRSFESADVGEYECVVSNEVGTAACTASARQKATAAGQTLRHRYLSARPRFNLDSVSYQTSPSVHLNSSKLYLNLP